MRCQQHCSCVGGQLDTRQPYSPGPAVASIHSALSRPGQAPHGRRPCLSAQTCNAVHVGNCQLQSARISLGSTHSSLLPGLQLKTTTDVMTDPFAKEYAPSQNAVFKGHEAWRRRQQLCADGGGIHQVLTLRIA